MDVGLKDPLAPVGNPPMVRATLPLKPLVAVTVTV